MYPKGSLPTRERGLKYRWYSYSGNQCHVAPHAGARIEIGMMAQLLCAVMVAPHAGARIEILVELEALLVAGSSLPTRERGLK